MLRRLDVVRLVWAVPAVCLAGTACATTGPDNGRSGDQATGVPTVVVVPRVDSIGVGQSVQFADTVLTSTGQVVTGANIVWGGTNPNVASVSINGRAVAIGKGKDTVEALVGGGIGKAVLIVGSGSLARIALAPSAPTVRNGSSVTLSAVFLDAKGDTLTGYTPVWTSTATNIATVSGTGVVTGVSPGTDTVKATINGISGVTVVSVVAAPVGSIVVVPAIDTLQIGSTVQLNDTVKDVSGNVLKGQPVTWSSSAPAVASVTTGRVTAVGPGTTQIGASAGGVTGAATIVVPANKTPVSERFVFDSTTAVPFGVPYDISRHVRWVLKNSLGDSVGATSLASVSGVAYVPVLGNGEPGACTVLAGTFVAYCPDGGWPAGAPVFQYNGYWSATVHAKSVKGVPDQHNTVFWFVNSGLAGSQPLSFTVSKMPAYTVVGGDTISLAQLDTIRVTTTGGLVVSSLPLVGWTSAVIQSGGSGPPGQAAPCNPGLAPTQIVCYPASNQIFQAVAYQALVNVQPAPFNGVSNPAFTGSLLLTVQVPPPPSVSISPADTVIVGDTLIFVASATDPGVPGTPVVSWGCCRDGVLKELASSGDTISVTTVGLGASTVTAYAATPGFSGGNEIGTSAATVLVDAGPPMDRIRRARTHLLTLRLRHRPDARR